MKSPIYRTVSEVFEDMVLDRTGYNLDSLLTDPDETFSMQTANAVEIEVVTRSYTDGRGNEARSVERSTILAGRAPELFDTKFYINDKEVEKLPEDLLLEMQVIDRHVETSITDASKPLPDSLVDGSVFPELNLSITADGNLKIQARVAGVDESRIQLSYLGTYLHIKISEDPPQPEVVTKRLFKGFEELDNSYEKRIYVDSTRFAPKLLKANLENGMLTILIPKTDSKANELVFSIKPSSKTTKKKRLVETTEA